MPQNFGKLALILLTMFASNCVGQKCLPDSEGKEFVFAFPPNRDLDVIGLFIQPATDMDTTVEVNVPLIEGSQYRQNISLPAGSGHYRLDLPADLVSMNTSGISNRSIAVSANREISLLAFNHRDFSVDTFTVFPTGHLGTEYFVAVYPGAFHLASTVLISSLSETTNVAITLSGSVAFLGVRYEQNDVITHTLNPYETIQLDPSSIQFTGTRIVTDSPVAVIVGTSCANIPTTVFSCDHLAEMLPPFDTWGKSFVVTPQPQRTGGYVYQLVAGRDNTVIDIYSDLVNEQITLNSGDHYTTDVTTQIMTSLTSSLPLQVVVYSKSTTSSERGQGDPSMAVVPPTEQYVHRAEFAVPIFPDFTTLYVGVTADCLEIENILYNGVVLSEATADETYMITRPSGMSLCTRWLPVNNVTHEMKGFRDEGDIAFTVQVYGIGVDVGYSHYSGVNAHKLTCGDNGAEVDCSTLTVDTSTVTCVVWELPEFVAPQSTTPSCASLATVPYNTSCSFECNTVGYELVGSMTSSCDANGYMTGCPPTCQNIDECLQDPNLCASMAGTNCTDTVGSYTCECLVGYEKVNDVCQNIDECARGTDSCDARGSCTDTDGSYTCSCPAGWELDVDLTTCTDIDECATGQHTCDATSQDCVNTQGSFRCDCKAGWTQDGSACIDIDECATLTPCDNTNGVCNNVQGSYTCGCQAGWELTADLVTCTDANECLRQPCDSSYGSCTNTEGTFTCACRLTGWTLAADQITCQDINECEGNHGCLSNETCVNNLGSFGCYPRTTPVATGGGPGALVIAGSVIGGLALLVVGLAVAYCCLKCCCVASPVALVDDRSDWEKTTRSFEVIANPGVPSSVYQPSGIYTYSYDGTMDY